MKRIHLAFGILAGFCLAMWAGPLWAGYVNNGNGTITDTSTGLTWQKDTPEDVVTWEEALAYCEALTLGGENDWRLPNIHELRSLVDYGRYNPSIHTTYFQNTPPSFFWSSTTNSSNALNAWGMFFLDGSGKSADKESFSRVRAVRGGQTTPPSPCLPDIKANGQDGPIIVSSLNTVTITASLAPGDENGKQADWWLLVAAFGDVYSLTPSGWMPGIIPLIQYPLQTVSPAEVYFGFLPVGTYVFYFGVDTNPNSILGLDPLLFYDYVVIDVIP